MRIGIVGFGLIGGSLSLAIKKNITDIYILALDKDEEVLKKAKKDMSIDDYTLSIDENFSNLDIIFICTPVDYVYDYVLELKKYVKVDCIITDVSSTKSELLDTIKNISDINFIGGHPMAGSEKSGYMGASDILFENAYYIVTPYENTKPYLLEKLKHIIDSIGAIYINLSPDEHDKCVSIISHMPHIIASSLVNYVKINDDADSTLKTLSAGGFKDITRIASSSGKLWQSIIFSNKDYVLNSLNGFIKELKKINIMIENDDKIALEEYIDTGAKYRNSFTSTNSFMKKYSIYIDVKDEPKIIGIIATILGENGINIKNIGIVHNREDNPYALEVVFENDYSMKNAIAILKENNFKIAND